jgi:hypothetical protein
MEVRARERRENAALLALKTERSQQPRSLHKLGKPRKQIFPAGSEGTLLTLLFLTQ